MPKEIIIPHDITEFYGAAWEKQEFEGARAFAAFKTYRDMPAHTRSVKNALIELYGRIQEGKLRTWYGWSSQFRWVWRAQEWDKEKDRVEQAEHIKAIKEMRTRHVRVGQALFSIGVEGIKSLQEQIKTEPTLLTPKLILDLISMGVQLERDGLGVPEEVENLILEEIDNVTDFSNLNTLTLRRLIAERRRLMPPNTLPEPSDDNEL